MIGSGVEDLRGGGEESTCRKVTPVNVGTRPYPLVGRTVRNCLPDE